MAKKKAQKSRKAYQKAYRRTKQGFLIHLYHRIVNRTKGITTNTPELYLGLPVLSNEAFYSWIILDPANTFDLMFKRWEDNGYKRTLTPSVDRIDSSLGYIEGNIRWVTASQNSHYANQSRSQSSYQTYTTTSKRSA